MTSRTLRNVFYYLPKFGCISTGICYGGVGLIAIFSLLQLREGGADESSMLAILNDTVAGKLTLWVILTGTVSYIVWRFFEAVTDPYGYGNKIQGVGKRLGIALSTVADFMIVFAAMKVVMGFGNIQQSGQPLEEREFIGGVLEKEWGSSAVFTMGAVVLLVALVQFLYGINGGYKERMDIDTFRKTSKGIIRFLAVAGFASRGIILAITGFFLLRAAITSDAEYVVNTDKAFDFIGDNFGHPAFIVVATGTVFYGIFMLIQGVTHDPDKD